MARIMCTKGTNIQFEDAIRDALGMNGGSIESGTNASQMGAVPVMGGTNGSIPEWMTPYFREASDEEVAQLIKDSVQEVQSYHVDNLPGYDAHFVTWAVVDPEYEEDAGMHSIVQIVSEGGDVFPGSISNGRLYDVTDELQEVFSYYDTYDMD